MYVIMDQKKQKKNQEQKRKNSWTNLDFGSVNSVLCTKCNEMRAKQQKPKKKIKFKSKEILCKVAHTSEQFYSLKKI